MLMMVHRIGAVSGLVAFGALFAVTAPAADQGGAKPAVPECVGWQKVVRYRNYGYDHVVIIKNACDRRATCIVKTDVNPDPITVRVAPSESREVLTYMGSPARVFEADVQCELQR